MEVASEQKIQTKGVKIARFKTRGVFAVGTIRGTTPKSGGCRHPMLDPCVYCGDKADTWEHVLPRSEGGKGLNNQVRACYDCNTKRSSKPLLQYLLERYQNV